MKIKNWDMFAFVVAYHIALVALLPAFIDVFSWTAVVFFLVTYILGGMSITVGYHRLYAHKAYSANPFFEWCVLLSSALAFEMSALKWSHDHRIHHNHCDTDKDPYSIKKGLYISILPPLLIGFIVGVLASIMGVGGGFIMIPAMIYIIRMPTSVVIGTSLYQIIFVTAIVTLLHSYHNQTVDIILALILLLGGAIGAQIGVKLSSKLEGPMLRAALAVLVLGVGIVMASDLLIRPDETITLLIGGGSH